MNQFGNAMKWVMAGMWLGSCSFSLAAEKSKEKKDVRITIEAQITNGDKVEKIKEEYDNARDALRDLQRALRKAGVAGEENTPRRTFRFEAPGGDRREFQWEDRMIPRMFGEREPFGRMPPPPPMPNLRSNQPWLGIQMQELDEDLAEVLGVKKGVVVSQVMEKSPASKAGLKSGDVLTKIGKTTVEDPGEVREAVLDQKIGDKVTLTVVRDGKTMEVPVVLARHGEESPQEKETGPFGFALSFEGGKIVVTEVEEDSAAEKAGLEEGDIILEYQVGGRHTLVEKTDRFQAELSQIKEQGKSVMVLIERNGQRRFLVIKAKTS